MHSMVREFARQFLLWTPVAVHLNNAYGRIDRVEGDAMQPTLNPPAAGGEAAGDVVFTELLSGSYFWYQPGDVVLVSSPEEPDKQLVRRLVALQGHTIQCTVDGKPEKLTVPQGCCWLACDSPGGISPADGDALLQQPGAPIPLALIKGRVQAVVWPPQRMQCVRRTSDWKQWHVRDPALVRP